MSKILFLGDPHLKINNFQQSVAFLKWVDTVVEKYKPDIVCNLGDTFDSHAVVRSEISSEFKAHVKRVTLYCDYWHVLGNHEMFKPHDATYHALQAFDLPKFTVFDKRADIGDITIVPYVTNYEDFPLDTNKICITHNTFIGTDYGFKIENTGIDAGKVSADIIISGHIHKRQSFGKVVYPGTPFAHNANDVDEIKGLLLFDTKTFEQEFIESPFPMWKNVEFVVSSDNPLSNLNEILKKVLNSKDKFILKITGPKVELSAYLKTKEYLSIIKDAHVLPKLIANDKVKQKVSIKATSISDIMHEYVDKVYDGNIDKQLILQKIDKLLK